MRASQRTSELFLPALGYTGAQALLRVFENSLTPHSWSYIWSAEPINDLLGGGDDKASSAASNAMIHSLISSGCKAAPAAGGATSDQCKKELLAVGHKPLLPLHGVD